MKKNTTLAIGLFASVARNRFLRFSFILVLLLTGASYAQAQHCDGCNLNINGPDVVSVGQTVTYTVTPSPVSGYYSPYWDYYGYLTPYATIIDEGQYTNGDYYITLYFHTSGYTWLNFEGVYYHGDDYDEINLRINP